MTLNKADWRALIRVLANPQNANKALRALMALKAPTPDAYEAACKALAHWRKEARRLGKLAGVAPREMSK